MILIRVHRKAVETPGDTRGFLKYVDKLKPSIKSCVTCCTIPMKPQNTPIAIASTKNIPPFPVTFTAQKDSAPRLEGAATIQQTVSINAYRSFSRPQCAVLRCYVAGSSPGGNNSEWLNHGKQLSRHAWDPTHQPDSSTRPRKNLRPCCNDNGQPAETRRL
jgi:hypothetical protein